MWLHKRESPCGQNNSQLYRGDSKRSHPVATEACASYSSPGFNVLREALDVFRQSRAQATKDVHDTGNKVEAYARPPRRKRCRLVLLMLCNSASTRPCGIHAGVQAGHGFASPACGNGVVCPSVVMGG